MLALVVCLRRVEMLLVTVLDSSNDLCELPSGIKE